MTDPGSSTHPATALDSAKALGAKLPSRRSQGCQRIKKGFYPTMFLFIPCFINNERFRFTISTQELIAIAFVLFRFCLSLYFHYYLLIEIDHIW